MLSNSHRGPKPSEATALNIRHVEDALQRPELVFMLNWKNIPKDRLGLECDASSLGILDIPELDISTFKTHVRDTLEFAGDISVSYVDSDNDEVPIDSKCEFEEAIKFARKRCKNGRKVQLLIDIVEKDKQIILDKAAPAKLPVNMAPTIAGDPLDDQRTCSSNTKSIAPTGFSATSPVPPIWFQRYMEVFKNEIVEKISTKVTADVLGIMNNQAGESVCSSCRRILNHGRNSGDSNTEGKQHRRKKKRIIDEADSSDMFNLSQIHDIKLLRKVTKPEKHERKALKKLGHKLEKLEQIRNSVERKHRCRDNVAFTDIAKDLREAVDSIEISPKIAIDSNVTSAEPLKNDDRNEYDGYANLSNPNKGKPRMNCSVTGQEMFDKSTGHETIYYSDSDNDHFSIISGGKDDSDSEHDDHFEMVHPPAYPRSNNFYLICDGESDRNNNRDSLSYEVISEPPSSISSIQLDEDHFDNNNESIEPPSKSDLTDVNRGKADAKTNSIYVIDTDGKIFAPSVADMSPIMKCDEINLDKRPGGSYAYVNDSLTRLVTEETRELPKTQSTTEQKLHGNVNLSLNINSSQPSYVTRENIFVQPTDIPASDPPQFTARPQGESSRSSQEPTHSFTSHSSHSTSHDGYNFRKIPKTTGQTGPKYTVIDYNVSKGLGDTKYTSFENDLGGRTCQTQIFQETKETNGKYQRKFTSEATACVFTEQPKNSSNGDGDTDTQRPNLDSGRTTHDSVHILPETLVSGAVNVASSAYSTARRVIEKIRNMQTGDDHDRNETGGAANSNVEEYFALLEDMGFTNMELNARLLSQYNYDLPRVISDLVQ